MSAQTRADFHALLTDEYIAVANRGRPFTREGLRAVCQAHISPKGGNGVTPIVNEADGASFLQEIRYRRLAAYKIYPSDLLEHARAEHVLRSEYAGRILLELLQNAHDAIATEPIGSKGVGFKAVLNVCEGPRIHSGPLHCGFDRHRSRAALQDAGFVHGNESVPLMRLPFPISETDEPQPVRDLIAEYDTVVVLPFIGQSAGERFLKEWAEYAGDPTLLLFLPSLRRIVWERGDEASTSKRAWDCERGSKVVEIRDGDDMDAVDRWRLSSSTRASVALRLDSEGGPVREKKYPSIRVFFETDERSPLPILIHADFPLKEGRTNVLIEDEASGAHLLEVTQEVAHLVRDALAEVGDAGLLLDLLRPRVAPEEMGKLEGGLWNVLKNAIASLEIPGASGLKLNRIRLRPAGESHKTSWWWFDCDLWAALKEVLSDHRVGQLSGLSLLPAGIDTEEREKTILQFNPDARLSTEELRALPLLPVEGSGQPVSPGTSNVFFPPDDPPASPLEGIEVRFLDQRFAKAIENHEERANLRKLLIELLGVSEFEPLSLIEKAILPVLREGRQPYGLLGFLCRVVAPALQKDDLIFDWRNAGRRELAECLKIPLRNGMELPAAQVYAGAEWTGSDFLERAYGSRSDRGFLQPPPADREQRDCWERFYRWTGVGWYPKVLPIVCFANSRETFEGPMWKDGVFPVDDEPEGWREYCGTLDDFGMGPRKARLRQNWTLDSGNLVLMQEGALSVFSDNWEYYAKYQQAIIFRSSNLREDFDNEKKAVPSQLIWMCKRGRWIPVKRASEKQEPRNVFSRPEVVRELGGWGYELDGNADENFLDVIGVRSGWRKLADADWHRWLDESTRLSKDRLDQAPDLKRAVRDLYDAALRHWGGKDEQPRSPAGEWAGPIWCLERRDDNTEIWQLAESREDVYFVDRPDLDELRLPELWVFPIRLSRLEKAAKERFGLKMLSEHLLGKPGAGASVNSSTQAVGRRVEDRLPHVNAYLQMVDRESPGGLEQSSLPDVSVVQELKVQFRLDDRVVGNGLKLDAYHSRSDGRWTVWLDDALFDETGRPETSVWEYVASALVYAGDLRLDAQPCLKDLLLYEGADLTRKLLKLGVTKETVDRIVPADSVKAVDVGPRPGTEEPKIPDEESENEGAGIIIGPTSTRTPGGSGGRGGGASGRTGGPRPNSTTQPGREAQEWMRNELRKRLGIEGWRVSEAPKHDEELRETDIELHHDRFGSFHIEVKHCERDVIYWSENEVEKAKRNANRYFMVILTRNKEKHFEEYWITDPLEDLKGLARTGVWEWRGRQDGVELYNDSVRWDVPAPKPARPASFSFRVEIGQDWLMQHALGYAAVEKSLQDSNPLSPRSA